MTEWQQLMAFVIAIGCGVYVLLTGYGAVAEPVSIEEAQDWCNQHNGSLVNSNAVLHGGLHCTFENGTSVHMHEVNVTGENNG